MLMGGDGKYLFAGVELTPAVFGEIALALSPGKRVRRVELCRAVQEYHLQNGGLMGSQPVDRVANKALRTLEKKGLVAGTVALGLWDIGQKQPTLSNSQRDATTKPAMTISDADGTYHFADIRLTGAVFAELALQLFAGTTAHSTTIIETVTDYHVAHGGIAPKVPLNAGKAGLQQLSKKGIIYQVTRQNWKFPPLENSQGTVIDELADDDVEHSQILEQEAVVTNAAGTMPFIYVYDFPTYANHAEAVGLATWPHKIGFTRVTPDARVTDQVGTALPEHPRITLQIPHKSAAMLEKAIHIILELRGRKLKGPGTEWFMTSPQEIQSMIDWILGDNAGEDGAGDNRQEP